MAPLPVLRDGRLDTGTTGTVTIDTPQWRAWLSRATGFLVAYPGGTFTVRREVSGTRRGSGYWRAYRHVRGERRRVYLGGGDQVTAQALDDAARLLADLREPAQPPSGSDPVITKIRIPPPRERALPRPQLREVLDRATRSPLTLVCAPAGYGKTNALATWATARGGVAWLSLDRDDNDPVEFCRDLAAALAARTAPATVPLPPESVSSSPAARRRWVAGLVNALAGAARATTLVLDDYHRIDSPDVHDTVAHLVDHLPPLAHLVLAGRRPPPLPLARWRVQDRMADVDTAQLRLAHPESAAFLQEVMGVRVDAGTAGELHTATEGWLAGLQLAALALRRGVPAARAIAAARTDLDTYLVTEVLDALPAPTRDLVLRTGILSRLGGALCDALTGRTDGADTLRELVRQDLFVVPLDGDGRWYRYHHLFAAAVTSYAERVAPDLIRQAHHRAAAWHERHGEPPEAIEHALAAGEHELAARVLTRLAEHDGGLWLQERRVSRWLAALPEPALTASPVLCLLVYWALMRGTVLWDEPGTSDLEAWLERADAPSLPPALRGVHTALAAYRQFLDGAHETVAPAANTALGLLAPTQAGLRVQTAMRLIDVLCHGGPADHAARAEREFTDLSRPPYDVARRLDALLGLAVVHMLQGDLRRARAACDRAAELATSYQVDPAEHLHSTPTLRVELLLEWNQIKEAAGRFAGLGDAPVRHPDPGVRLHAFRVAADVCVATGDEAGALRALDDMAEYLASIPGFATPGFGAAARRSGAARRAYTLLSFGHLAAASTWLETARGIAQAGQVPPGLALYEATVAARLALAEPDPPAAATLAAAAAPRFGDVAGAACHIRLRVVAALAQRAMGEAEPAVAALAEALRMAGPGGFIRPFVEYREELAPLLAEVARRGRAGRLSVPRRYLDRVRNACTITAPAGPAPVLTAREREVLGLLAAGLSAPEAARRLGLARATVRTHVERINAKLDARTQAQAVARAYRLGLLDALPEHPEPAPGH